MRHIITIIQKQVKDTLKNKAVLIQFVMFPVMAVIMNSAVKIDGMPENFFADLFAAMYVGMAPLTAMASVISEEKEKNTLRVLLLSDVKPAEYLVGTGGYIWGACMLGAAVFCAIRKFTDDSGKMGQDRLLFMGIMAAGILVSILIGAAIGTWSRNQMSATSVTVPVMIFFAFLPMLAKFNDKMDKVAGLTYSGQISTLLNRIGEKGASLESVLVIAVNAVIALALFVFAYKKSGLSGGA